LAGDKSTPGPQLHDGGLPHRPPTQTRSHEAKSIHTSSFRVTVNGRLKSTPGARPAGAVGDGVLYDVTVRALHRAQTCVYLRKTQGLGGCLAWRTPLRLHARARESQRERGPLASRLSPPVPVPQVGRPRTRAAARRSPLTHHMPASPGIISLLTYTKAVMPSLPVVLKRILAMGWIFVKPWPHHTWGLRVERKM